ncbi:winged helix-turn-helix domain-containing protein [Rubellimicrobium sp. CFH 75288]|uniref:winged helix-turn-helix domain-containing protein n=1 Tax=Rubellimicrobium sp. CFH 75288 TaxID=2697034 RepID=UPI00352B9B39
MAAGASFQLRIPLARGARFGPGKAALLALIRQTGSVAAAAERMGMSYRRAWGLVVEANRAFRTPLVTLARGGEGDGGARLTKEGEAVLASYRALEALLAREGAPFLAAIRDRALPDGAAEMAPKGVSRKEVTGSEADREEATGRFPSPDATI